MTLDHLLSPVSDDLPCGPDLNADMDPDYDDYYFGALGRLPDFFAQAGVQRNDGSRTPDRLFDPKSVELREELSRIDALLARSRDIRLLTLRAQWAALAGQILPVVESVEAIAGLLKTFPETVHPGLGDGSAERRDAIQELNLPVTLLQPLQFCGLTGGSEISLRRIKVARGQLQPLESEGNLVVSALMDGLGSAANRVRVDEVHAGLMRMQAALAGIRSSCMANPVAPFGPTLDGITGVLEEMLAVIGDARPDLRVTAAPPPEPEAPAPAEEAAEEGAAPMPAAAPAGPPPSVVSQAHAKLILETCEDYYRRFEPSSAALLLVVQARKLIGKPLIEALEILLPEEADRAKIDFGPQTGFEMRFSRLRSLSEDWKGPSSTDTETELPPPPALTNSAEAANAIRSVEDYFRRFERSSPVPVLLQRARSYLDKDFQSLIDELIPQKG